MKIELARVGTFGADATEVKEEDLKQIEETFEGEVPITLGHSLADFMPAFGWVKSVEYDSNSRTLYGEVELSDLLKEAFDEGMYKKWSVGIRKRGTDGKSYLHHVAFLGAVPPKIKDLKILDAKFVNMSDADTEWVFDLSDKPKPPPLKDLEIVDDNWDATEAKRRVFDKYGIEGLKAYCLYKDPEADPNNKTAYKFLVVDIKNGKPVIIAKALSASLAYLHGARGVKIPEDVAKVIRPKLEKLLKKKEEKMEEQKKQAKKEMSDDAAKKIAQLEEKLKQQKRESLKQAIEGKIPKEKQALVFELADNLSIEETIELSDEEGKKKASAYDLLIEIFNAIPKPVKEGEAFSDYEEQKINYSKLVEHI